MARAGVMAPVRAWGGCEQHTHAIGESVDRDCHNRGSMHAAFDCMIMLTTVAVLAAAEEAADNTHDAVKVCAG